MTEEGASLEQVEGDVWGDPPAGSTPLVRTVYALRRKPLDRLDVEDLRLALGQDVGAATLVPRALAALERDPLAEGDYYPGDLLVAVLGLPPSFWTAHGGEADRLDRVVAALPEPDALGERDAPADRIAQAVRDYRSARA